MELKTTARALPFVMMVLLAATQSLPASAQEQGAASKPAKRRKLKPAADSAPASFAPPTEESKAGGSEFDQFEGEFGKEGQGKAVSDPIVYWNRSVFWVNDKLYYVIFKPAALVYGFVLPEPVRIGINNAFYNYATPVRLVNTAFQGKFADSGKELGRLLINTTVGLGGLWDPADKWFGMKKPNDTDFGQTFGKMGIGTGFPVVLPLLGQTNLRDGIGLVPNSFVDPVYYVTNTWTYLGITAGGRFNDLSLHIGDYEKIKRDSLDPYTFIRDAHLQNREKKIKE